MITKEMLKRCLNEKMQAFCALDKDVQDAINENKAFKQCLCYISDRTSWENDNDEKPTPNYIYRLSPDTPAEQEWEEYEIRPEKCGYMCYGGPAHGQTFFYATARVNFLGIVYLLNGVETLRTSIDAAFGVPVRVRFSK